MRIKSSRISLVLALCSLTLTLGCGTQSPSSEASAKLPYGCSQDVSPIAESDAFTPYDERLSVRIGADQLGVESVGQSEVPAGVPDSLDGLPLAGISDSRAVYSEATELESRSALLKSGGLILDFSPDPDGGAIVGELAKDPDTGDRVVITEVGSYPAALSWADPDAQNVRPHHLLWSDDSTIWTLQGVREADEIVRIARAYVCSPIA